MGEEIERESSASRVMGMVIVWSATLEVEGGRMCDVELLQLLHIHCEKLPLSTCLCEVEETE
jgi:hypothetical protein